MSARRPYVRSMDGWWKRDPFFIRYMAREATAVFVVIYAAILLVGVVRLAQGEAAFNAWLQTLRSGSMVALHALLFVVFLYHTYTWFEIMPKTMPPVVIGGRRLPAAAITASGIAASAVLSAAVWIAVKVMLG